ncbi:hypothetical protein [Hyphococcus sp.]|uniref:hypothetical protein n=1 Tax=Hyphococcus sp. TaxID=2038636 RepID=UPI00207EB96E|nr:MAG: hypothetical protein DHS20C04_00480 [Marinicaulis sp.]
MCSLKLSSAAFATMTLGGCLVSETPILDATNGKAKPFEDGLYQICDGAEGDESADCNVFSVKRDETGAYAFIMEGEDPAAMRFRRVARNAYAVQSAEDDSFAYYFGAGDSQSFQLTLMNCKHLPSALRARLISRNDLSTEHEDFEFCTVNTLKGLTAAAKAYHRDIPDSEDELFMVMTPAGRIVEE